MKNNIFEINAITDKGKTRKNNEDNFFVNDYFLSYSQSDSGACFHEETAAPFVAGISDGMGGEKSGEEAAFIAASSFYKNCRQFGHPLSTDNIRQCIDEINRTICICKPKSGATLVMLYACGEKITAVSVGDSRIYRYSNGRLSQISTDHTIAQMQVDMHLITKEQAKESQLRHSLTQFLGIPPEEMILEPDFSVIDITDSEDIFLLCSDGLTEMVDDGQIEKILSADAPLKIRTENLVKAALDNGGKDNITVMTIKAV